MSSNFDHTEGDDLDRTAQLNELRSSNPFLVPSGYFDYLPSEIMTRKDKADGKKLSSSEVFLPQKIVRYAAVIAVFISVAVIGLSIYNVTDRQIAREMEYELYLENYWLWYSYYQQVDFYDMILASNMVDHSTTEESEDVILEYLNMYTYYDDSVFE